MSLVDSHQPGPGRREQVEYVGMRELLRRHEHEAGTVVRQQVVSRPATGVVTGVQFRDLDACGVFGQGPQLVPLESHQGAHHDRHSTERQPGELVDGGLAGPGGEDGERVLSREDRLDGFLLPRAQRVESEPLASELGDVGGAQHPPIMPQDCRAVSAHCHR